MSPVAPSADGPKWLSDLFATIDDCDSDGFTGFLTPDASFRFGSSAPVVGRAEIRVAVAGFFETIAGLEHRVDRVWHDPERLVCEGVVTYTRHDGSRITLPFVDVFGMREGRIAEYLIYMDIAPLYAPSG